MQRYLGDIVERVREALGSAVIGIYPTGSIALGDFRPGRSDVDVMAVVEGEVGRPGLLRLAGELDSSVLACPAAGLEFVVYPLATVRTGTLSAGYLLNLNTGPQLSPVVSLDPGEGESFWYPIDRAVTRQCGVSLFGPPPGAFFADVPVAELLPLVRRSVEANLPLPEGALADNAVLNACRALAFAETGRWAAKREAAERVLAAGGPHAAVILTALDSFDRGRAHSSTLSAGGVEAFLIAALARLS